MKTLNCHECRELLPAYVGRELKPQARRLVAAHLDQCDACDRLCQSQRTFAREMTADLPAFGRADDQRLSRMWTAVQAEMRAPRKSVFQRSPARTGMALLAILVIAILPLSIGGDQLLRFTLPPVPPTPITEARETVVSTADLVSVVAMATSAPKAASTTMPTRPNQPNYAPTAVATDSP